MGRNSSLVGKSTVRALQWRPPGGRYFFQKNLLVLRPWWLSWRFWLRRYYLKDIPYLFAMLDQVTLLSNNRFYFYLKNKLHVQTTCKYRSLLSQVVWRHRLHLTYNINTKKLQDNKYSISDEIQLLIMYYYKYITSLWDTKRSIFWCDVNLTSSQEKNAWKKLQIKKITSCLDKLKVYSDEKHPFTWDVPFKMLYV